APGKIIFRFHVRDLHLVLGTTKEGRTARFTVKMYGTVPRDAHSADVDNNGSGTVKDHRLYQLIRQKGPVEDRTFEIEFLDPGVQAFAFTFGLSCDWRIDADPSTILCTFPGDSSWCELSGMDSQS